MTMDRTSRVDRRLPSLFDELAGARTPDYLEAAIERASSRSQRPAWTFPGRWIPMAEITSRSAFAPRLPWRAIGVALVLLAVLLSALAVYVGRQQRLPAPFGPARNGLITYSANGDIYTVDPATGDTTAIVSGPDMDRRPMFSPDGTRLAFLRARPGATDQFDLIVAAKDGSAATALTPESISMDAVIEWAPDGTFLIVNDGEDAALTRYDATAAASPTVIARGVHIFTGAFRPPAGAQILYEADTEDATSLWVMDSDGSQATKLFERPAIALDGSNTANARWSPDGTMIALGISKPMTGEALVNIIAADGSGLRQVGQEQGTWAADGVKSVWVEDDIVWSPDSRTLAFNRWERDKFGTWLVRPIGVVPAAGGVVKDLGPAPASEGAVFDFSPDGSTIVSVSGTFVTGPTDGSTERPSVIDARTGTSTLASWVVASGASWQRLAPD